VGGLKIKIKLVKSVAECPQICENLNLRRKRPSEGGGGVVAQLGQRDVEAE